MRTMKKLICAFIATVIFTALPLCATAVGEESKSFDFENLSVLGIKAESFSDYNPQRAAKRSELAYIASKLTDMSDYDKTATAFSDVTEENELSGYIRNANNRGIINGKGDGTFAPDENVSADNVYKVLVVAAGYEALANALGGYPDGYRQAASQLGFYSDISTDINGNVTLKGLFEGAEKLLSGEYDDLSVAISDKGITVEKSGLKKSIFSDRHNIGVYEGVVTNINDIPYSATVTIKKNLFESNKIKFYASQKAEFLSKTNINLFLYENADVKLWVDNDTNTILYAALTNGVEVRFTAIASVNSDENPANKYSSKHINYLKLYDDKKNYRTTDDFSIKSNLVKTTAPVYLTDRVAKVVIKDGLISFVETWELSEGGIITEITGEYIKFICGDNENKKIDKLNSFARVTVYKNNSGSDIKELRADSYFDYYISDDKLVIIASEKKISDVLMSVGTKEVEIGNGIYNKNKDIYVKGTSGSYTKNGDLSTLFNTKVDAYFDAAGFMRYISSSASNASDNRFLGVIIGSISDTFNEKIQFKVLSFEGTREEKELNLAKNYKITCGKTIDELILEKADVNAKNVFEFILNAKGEIAEIKAPDMFYGYETATVTVTQFTYDSPAYATVDGKVLYFDKAPLVILLEEDGKLTTKTVTWTEIYGMRTTGAKMRFYGDGGMNSNVRMVLISGSTDKIYSRVNSLGFVTKKTKIYEDDKIKTQVTVVAEKKESKYILSDDEAKKLTSDKMYISYALNKFGDSDLSIVEAHDISKIITDPTSYGWVKEPIYKADSRRMYFEDGRAFFFSLKAIIMKKEADGEYTNITADEICEGDTVIYKPDTSGIKITIVE